MSSSELIEAVSDEKKLRILCTTLRKFLVNPKDQAFFEIGASHDEIMFEILNPKCKAKDAAVEAELRKTAEPYRSFENKKKRKKECSPEDYDDMPPLE